MRRNIDGLTRNARRANTNSVSRRGIRKATGRVPVIIRKRTDNRPDVLTLDMLRRGDVVKLSGRWVRVESIDRMAPSLTRTARLAYVGGKTAGETFRRALVDLSAGYARQA